MERPLYELDCELLSPTAFHDKYSQLIAPTSLFKKLGQREFRPVVENVETERNERPLTPVEESIKAPVKSFSQLSNILRKRIKAKSQPVPGLTANQQQSLMGVVVSELGSSWSEIKRLAPDPFLNIEQNHEVERFLAIELINIAEDLYFDTIDRAKDLNDRGVFTTYANNSRLKAQLALEANQSFDVRKIHKRLASGLKQTLALTHNNRASASDSDHTLYTPKLARFNPKGRFNIYIMTWTKTANMKSSKRAGMKKRPTLATLVVPPRLTREQKDKKRRDSDINQLQTQMPHISLEKVEETFGLYSYDLYKRPADEKEETAEDLNDNNNYDGQNNLRSVSGFQRRSQSLPDLQVGESLLEELGIPEDGQSDSRRKSVDNFEINLACGGAIESIDNVSALEGVRVRGSSYLSADLKRLVSDETYSKVPTTEQDQDLPPLLQALSYESTKKKKAIQSSVEVDNEESEVASTVASSVACQEDIDENNAAPPVQPATVTTILPNKTIVRTSDVRVSNRVNKSEVTLKTFPTVYNDLIGEVDPATVKWLDRNLYIGDEIREVYEEVIKTVGTDHLLFDQLFNEYMECFDILDLSTVQAKRPSNNRPPDPYVENHATGVVFSNTVHSAMLSGSKDNRIINPSLHRDIPPPWGKHPIDEWKNSPMFGELGRQDILNMGAQGMGDFPGKASKSYNSWLAWWRSTISADDYFKYLSTQDNDYLSLTYHLYESDDGDSDNDGDKDRKPNARELELKRAREEKIAEIRKLKEHYDTGYWNANSVLLGGLGKYPEIADEELGIDLAVNTETPSNDEDSSLEPCSPSTNGERSQVFTPLSLQDRLERVWTLMCMPDNLRLDMAIKYSSETYIDTLEEVLQLWESAVKLILSRENLITKLEDFERLASDPNRFFEKGSPGSASSRIKEAKTRKQFHHKLDKIEIRIKKIVEAIYETFGDVVTFQGRPYMDKMSSDRTEMLYWLQQERRQTALDMAKKTVELKMLEMPASMPVNNVV